MPVFIEKSSSHRDSRVNPAVNHHLPRLIPVPEPSLNGIDCHEVVIVGSGPAGMMLTVLLARYGLSSVLTVEEKTEAIKSGQADGLQPRTLEVLQSLDLAHEILTQGCQMHEVAFWNPKNEGKGPGIERTSFVNDVNIPSRYRHEVTIHQGRIERILGEDLEKRGAGNYVRRGWKVTGWEFEYSNMEFPVLVRMEKSTDISSSDDVMDGSSSKRTRLIRAKYLVGADGARSVVREGMGEKLVGDHTDHVWGVVDAIVKTDFPDIRKRSAIHSPVGSIMIIPRERVSPTEVITRVYCQMEDAESDPSVSAIGSATSGAIDKKAEEERASISSAKERAKKRRQEVSLERILSQIKKVLEPYPIDFGEVDWWAAYQIGQRTAQHFSMADKLGNLRIHIAGDACHTHSPKAGQGMNVSMMDAYNLSWKLAHALLGLAADPNALLATYESERLDIARQLIEFDTKFSSMFSGKIGEEHGLTHEEFVHVFRTGGGFTSGCGIEYKEGLLVMRNTAHSNGQTAAQKRTSEVRSLPASHGKIPMLKKLKEILVGRKVANNHKIAQEGATPETGLLTPGRRLLNVKVSRFADANPRNIHDDLPSTSRYRVIALLPAAYTTDPVAYFPHLIYLTETLPALFPPSLIESIIIHPHEANHSLEWMTHFPKCVREKSEWLVFGDEFNEAYKNWGVDREKGAVAVVRPDGYVGVVTEAEELFGGGKELLREYLERLLKRVEA